MPVAKVTELSATSDKSFEDAIQQGIDRATRSGNVKGARSRRCASRSITTRSPNIR